jgi:LacI family transcriptional regulator
MAATIKQVAERAGVSMSTVSHVLNGTHYVSPELTQRVLEAVNELEYRQNPVARILAGGRSHVIGVLVPDLFNSYAGEIIRGLDDELLANDYEMMLYTPRRGQHLASSYATTFPSGLVVGMVILVPQGLNEFMRMIGQQNIPYIVIDPEVNTNADITITSTNWQGAYDATEYLIKLGHQRIGFITGSMFLECAVDRLAGYQAALTDHGLPFEPELVSNGDFIQSTGFEAANQLLDLPVPPTAIFASNDASALGAVDAIRSLGLHIPDDISVLGFDDSPQAATMCPALTSIRQPLIEMGRKAAQLLLQYIQQPETPPESVCLPTQLVIRESCQPPTTSAKPAPRVLGQKGDAISPD